MVGEGSDEEQLFSRGSSTVKDGTSTELDGYLQRLKVWMSLTFFSLLISLFPPYLSVSFFANHPATALPSLSIILTIVSHMQKFPLSGDFSQSYLI